MTGGRERARQLMMARLDGEISEQERAELDRLLSQDGGLQDEWKRLAEVKEVTGAMTYHEPSAETWEHYWVSVYNRLERGVGWVLVSLGVTVLVAYGVWHAVLSLLADTEVPGFIKAGIFAAALGAVLLLVSVIREKLFTRRGERYDEVQR